MLVGNSRLNLESACRVAGSVEKVLDFGQQPVTTRSRGHAKTVSLEINVLLKTP